ncbi:hypothetical protein VFPPC_14909 [Pochonia chlamydosporia 170]|uniref:Uncharacterized protein n=1 Tax=Pochonia chlamydosporia 170 TaxID=1380566 RepID=A0A179EYA2_METCM|nr:hypothetical protein VFPPC_14909 [Pochonia chlamydosporia 170]OAQ57879.2 hypothetical protein VFPPC_14909 [Pochonia chlamydosporia 170]
MFPLHTPDGNTDTGKVQYVNPNIAFIWPSDLLDDDDKVEEATNVNTPTTIVEDANGDGFAMSSCPSEESQTGKDETNGPVHSWVLHGIDDDGVETEKIFYPQFATKHGVLWRYFLATYANGAEKKVRLVQEPTSQLLIKTTPAARASTDRGSDKPDDELERWTIEAIYANGRRRRLYPDSIYDGTIPIRNWHMCIVQTNGDLKNQQIYPEICSPDDTLVRDSHQSYAILAESSGGLPVSDAGNIEKYGDVDEQTKISQRASIATTTGTKIRPSGGDDTPCDGGPSLKRKRTDDVSTPELNFERADHRGEVCINFHSHTTTGGAAERTDSDDNALLEKCSKVPDDGTDRSSDGISDAGQTKDTASQRGSGKGVLERVGSLDTAENATIGFIRQLKATYDTYTPLARVSQYSASAIVGSLYP